MCEQAAGQPWLRRGEEGASETRVRHYERGARLSEGKGEVRRSSRLMWEILYGFCELFYNYCPVVTGDGVGLRSVRAGCGFPRLAGNGKLVYSGLSLSLTGIRHDNE